MATLPPLHVRKHLFHQPCQAKDVCVKELLHGGDTLALQRPNHANTCIVHYNSRVFYVTICLWRNPKWSSDVLMDECKREMPDQEHPPVCLAGCWHTLWWRLHSRHLIVWFPGFYLRSHQLLSPVVPVSQDPSLWQPLAQIKNEYTGCQWLFLSSAVYHMMIEESEWLTFEPSELILGQPCSHSQADARGASSHQHPPGPHGSLTFDLRA